MSVVNPECGEIVRAEFSDHDQALDPAVIENLLVDTVLAPIDGGYPEGWRAYANSMDRSRPLIADCRGRVEISTRLPWQMLAGHYFLHHVMRQQPEMVFLHGATVVIGQRCVFLGGTKGSGKSTLALALACRGHGFLGDEVAAIRRADGIAVPFRRAISVRAGPQARRAVELLRSREARTEKLPDGTTRTRVSISQILPGSLSPEARLTDAVFLEGFAQTPQVEQIRPGRDEVPLFGALPAMFSAQAPGRQALELLNLFSGLRCHRVRVGGSPDEMAEVIEKIVEGNWHSAFSSERSASEPIAG